MENSINEFYNEDDLKLTPKLYENKNNKFGKSPLMMPTLSKVIKRKVNNNNLLQKSQQIGKEKEREQLYLEYHRNSINNINNYRANLPNIINSLTPNERRNNYKRGSMPKNKSPQGGKTTFISRNFDLSMLGYNNSDIPYFFENEQLNNTFNLKRFNKIKNNKYNDNDSLSQIIYKNQKNNIYLGNNNNSYSRNNENNLKNNLSPSYISQNNINPNNYNKLKFSLNKKNLMHTIKKPSKINLEKKNFKYKIPLDIINNYNYGKKKILNDIVEENQGNNRKLHLKQRNNKSLNKDKIDYNNIDNQNENKDININDSKSFIQSTLIAFNGLVSQAQELGQILIDNKEMINSNNKSQINNNLQHSINDENDTNVKSKINKLNQEIKNEHKTVEELQKINSDLNNKINIFNENTQQYENKVKELVTVINQIKNSNTASNSNSNSDNFSNGLGNNNNVLRKDSSNNFMLENKPKKKKMKFGFVETIFMKDDKFEIILKKKPPKYEISNSKTFTINKTNKEPKLFVVNVNKNNDEKNEQIKETISNEQYLDAASQIANHLIIESLLLLENEGD